MPPASAESRYRLTVDRRQAGGVAMPGLASDRPGASAPVTADRAWVLFGVIAGGWTVFGLFSFATLVVYSALRLPPSVPWARLFVLVMASAWAWAALTPLALWATHPFAFAPRFRLRSLAVHAAVHAVVGLAFVVISTGLERSLAAALGLHPPTPFLQGLVYHRFDTRFLAYLVIVTLAQATRYFQLTE